jgi:hypothetical protein
MAHTPPAQAAAPGSSSSGRLCRARQCRRRSSRRRHRQQLPAATPATLRGQLRQPHFRVVTHSSQHAACSSSSS